MSVTPSVLYDQSIILTYYNETSTLGITAQLYTAIGSQSIGITNKARDGIAQFAETDPLLFQINNMYHEKYDISFTVQQMF